jgi:hypothetical protein
MAYKTIYTEVEVEVDVDLDDFSDNDLLEEIERRNIQPNDWSDPNQTQDLIYKMYEKVCLNKNIDEELREFFWRTIGRTL